MRRACLALAAFLAAGCARFPSVPGQNSTRIIVTMTVSGQLKPNYVYVVAMNFTPQNPPTTGGPIPVVRSPWGNGFVAGTVSNFVRWDPNILAPGGFGLFKFQDPDLLAPVQIGIPVTYEEVQPGGKTLRFSVDISQLGLSPVDQAALQVVQINMLTMDRVPTGSDPGTKIWDALGDSTTISGINEWINVPLYVSGTYNNVQGIQNQGLEAANDLSGQYDPDLDIVSWQVEVQRP